MKNLKPRGLHEHVIDEIGRRIIGGEFVQGKAKVLDAIAERDPAAARVAMQKLIEDSQRAARDVRRTKAVHGAGTPARKTARGPRL